MGYRDPDAGNLFLIGDWTADWVVGAADDERKRLEKIVNSRDLRGRENASRRKLLRHRVQELRCVISGLNTGDGVTRKSARD